MTFSQLTRRQITQSIFAAATLAPLATRLHAKTVNRFSTQDGLALKGFDTTAYFTQNAPSPGTETHKVNWKGATWRFATLQDAAAFQAAPDSYAPQFGGYCTRAMSIKREVPADPEVWRIHNNKLYVFFAPKGGRLFDKDPDDMIARAQAHWESLTKTE